MSAEPFDPHSGVLPPLAVTLGEPGGIGPDIIISLWNDLRSSLTPFIVYGDPAFFSQRATELGIALPLQECDPGEAGKTFQKALPVCPLENPVRARPGQASSDNAPAVLESLERAVHSLHDKSCRALVTAPIQKKTLYEAGFSFEGHTDYLQDKARIVWGHQGRSVMMLVGPDLRTVPVTVHIPLKQITHQLTQELLEETLRIVHADLISRFDCHHPRLAVSGLNPHAGEDGTMGTQEDDIIIPVLKRLRAEGLNAQGPYPADTMFTAQMRQSYDVAICMYHDQALIPVKTLAMDETVNVTLGLPFVRTSPDHGTALDIAGQGKARPMSFLKAIHLADEMTG
jgi:4-hydroxythreonine-4-phosphate dehydrogenase